MTEERKFAEGDTVRKTKGSSWQGKVVGFYSTALTPVGYAVESEREPGSVQIYPEAVLEMVDAFTPTPVSHPMGAREAARQEAARLIERAGLEMEEEYDLLVDDISETMLRFAAVPPQPKPDDRDADPAQDERWNAGLDYGMTQLCKVLKVDPETVTWDAATETLDGDVQAVLLNILRGHFGEDWGPAALAATSEGQG